MNKMNKLCLVLVFSSWTCLPAIAALKPVCRVARIAEVVAEIGG